MKPNTIRKFLRGLADLPDGASKVSYLGKTYLVTKEILREDSITKVFAKDLSGTDFVSFNLYKLPSGYQLKPCEMTEEKVINFVLNYEFIQPSNL